MLIEGDETGAFHFELMTAFIYQDRLPLKVRIRHRGIVQ
jgi:hypothetical protein